MHEYEKERVAAGVRDVAQLRVPFAEVFERFTERARQVVVLAREEACIFKHNYIGTEHILLGVLRVEEGLGARVLRSLDITVERTRAQVVQIVGLGAPYGASAGCSQLVSVRSIRRTQLA